ncbi:MAG: class I SAM-dependent methyltransferase [Planctomycetota bacterium]
MPEKTSDFTCVLCGSHTGRERLRKGDLLLARCDRCALVQQHPMPSDADCAQAYTHETIYTDNITRNEDPHLRRDEHLLQSLAASGVEGPLLDVGAGAGLLLRAGIGQGWDVVGLELSGPSAERLRTELGVPVFEGAIESVPLESEAFGLVTFSHCLEHLPDPVSALRAAARTLMSGGHLHIAVPNWSAAKRVVAGKFTPWIYQDHLTYFTRKTLERLLEAAGFRPLEWSVRPFQGEDFQFVLGLMRRYRIEGFVRRFLRMGDRPLEELIEGSTSPVCPPWRYRAVLSLSRGFLRAWPESLLCALGRGEELRVTAQLTEAPEDARLDLMDDDVTEARVEVSRTSS